MDLGMLAQAAADEMSWGDIVSCGVCFVLGAGLVYIIGNFNKQTSGEIAEARKEGYENGNREGREQGMRKYRKAVEGTLDANCASIARADPQSGGHVKIPREQFLDEADERAEYESQ